MLRVLLNCLAGQHARLPETIIRAVRGTNKLAEARLPATCGKVSWMQIAGPDALECELEGGGGEDQEEITSKSSKLAHLIARLIAGTAGTVHV